MALTNAGKSYVVKNDLDTSTEYISLHLTNDTELTGHGYARKALTSSDKTVRATDGRITGPTNFEIYTAGTNSAQQAQQVALYSAATGGNQLFEPEAIDATIPDAPANGQAFRLSLTLNF